MSGVRSAAAEDFCLDALLHLTG